MALLILAVRKGGSLIVTLFEALKTEGVIGIV